MSSYFSRRQLLVGSLTMAAGLAGCSGPESDASSQPSTPSAVPTTQRKTIDETPPDYGGQLVAVVLAGSRDTVTNASQGTDEAAAERTVHTDSEGVNSQRVADIPVLYDTIERAVASGERTYTHIDETEVVANRLEELSGDWSVVFKHGGELVRVSLRILE